MDLNEVHILPTRTTPEIFLNPKGKIKIRGRAIDESRDKVPEQITNWLDKYLQNPARVTDVTIALEFLNSFNTLVLTSILKKVAQVIQQQKGIAIHWHYEEDDVDIFERGEYISSTINVPIEFIITENIADC
jgi:SiaC family regulatory phosphoprotein